MSKRYKQKRRERYNRQRKKCQRCGEPGAIYTLEDFITNETVCVEVYCPKHASRAGYCHCCGQFWGGISSFEMNPTRLCDHCQDQLDADFEGSCDPDEDYQPEDFEPFPP